MPNDVLAPYIEEVVSELKSHDPQNKKDFNLEQTLDILEKYEIIQQFELNEFENESTFNCQFFLRVLHEVGMIDLRKNNVNFNEEEFNRSRAAIRNQMDEDDDDNDVLIDKNIEIEDIPNYYITDVNDLIFPLPKGVGKVFCKGYTYEKERVLYMD